MIGLARKYLAVQLPAVDHLVRIRFYIVSCRAKMLFHCFNFFFVVPTTDICLSRRCPLRVTHEGSLEFIRQEFSINSNTRREHKLCEKFDFCETRCYKKNVVSLLQRQRAQMATTRGRSIVLTITSDDIPPKVRDVRRERRSSGNIILQRDPDRLKSKCRKPRRCRTETRKRTVRCPR